MQYYWDTIENCVPPETILGVMKDVGLVEPVRHVVMKVFSEYSATKAR
jgi:demethylmenaquinone methyltransferase/2-methoxy-6-polyprenyl-1,4-benzoquinol methylase